MLGNIGRSKISIIVFLFGMTLWISSGFSKRYLKDTKLNIAWTIGYLFGNDTLFLNSNIADLGIYLDLVSPLSGQGAIFNSKNIQLPNEPIGIKMVNLGIVQFIQITEHNSHYLAFVNAFGKSQVLFDNYVPEPMSFRPMHPIRWLPESHGYIYESINSFKNQQSTYELLVEGAGDLSNTQGYETILSLSVDNTITIDEMKKKVEEFSQRASEQERMMFRCGISKIKVQSGTIEFYPVGETFAKRKCYSYFKKSQPKDTIGSLIEYDFEGATKQHLKISDNWYLTILK